MEKGKYIGSFDSREDVFSNFEIVDNGEEIIAASYDQEDYEGYAQVLYKKDNKFYEVYGSHCSCYGLENQWEPEEVQLEALKYRANNGDVFIKDCLLHAKLI